MKALLIKVNFRTGERPGGINPRGNAAMPVCWQDTDAGLEIRFVKDGNAEPFHDVEGIEVLDDADALDAALARVVKTTKGVYRVYNEALMAASIAGKNIDLRNIPPSLDPEAETEALFKRGALGIQYVEPDVPTAASLCKQWGIPLE